MEDWKKYYSKANDACCRLLDAERSLLYVTCKSQDTGTLSASHDIDAFSGLVYITIYNGCANLRMIRKNTCCSWIFEANPDVPKIMLVNHLDYFNASDVIPTVFVQGLNIFAHKNLKPKGSTHCSTREWFARNISVPHHILFW